jgi:hypothetical protein
MFYNFHSFSLGFHFMPEAGHMADSVLLTEPRGRPVCFVRTRADLGLFVTKRLHSNSIILIL